MAHLSEIENPSGIMVLGDTHASPRSTTAICNLVPRYRRHAGMGPSEPLAIVQLGDFEYWPHTEKNDRWRQDVDKYLEYLNAYMWFMDGNHENHIALADLHNRFPSGPKGEIPISSRIAYLPRGTSWEWSGVSFVAFGGAVSIDRANRYENFSWFEQEAITYGQVRKFTSRQIKADVLLCHDSPAITADWIVRSETKGTGASVPPDLREASRQNRVMLSEIAAHCRPSIAIHGHWHYRVSYNTTTADGSHSFKVEALGHERSQKYMSCWLDLPGLEIHDTVPRFGPR